MVANFVPLENISSIQEMSVPIAQLVNIKTRTTKHPQLVKHVNLDLLYPMP